MLRPSARDLATEHPLPPEAMKKRLAIRTEISLSAVLTLLGLSALLLLFYLWYGRDTTIYAEGYSDSAFATITPGMVEGTVYEILGQPLSSQMHGNPETWYYSDGVRKMSWGEFLGLTARAPGEAIEYIEFSKEGLAETVHGRSLQKVKRGMLKEQILELAGKPLKKNPRTSKALHYSLPSGDGVFHARIVNIDENGLVSGVTTYEFHD